MGKISKIVILFLAMISSAANAKSRAIIEVQEPSFTAEKIELNPITNSYVVVNPKYYINNVEYYPVLASGSLGENTSAANHLCRFLGLRDGKVLSVGRLPVYDCERVITILKEGLYRKTKVGDYRGKDTCPVIEFLECAAK